MTTAIAILNWNGEYWLEKFLPTVVLHSPNTHIYIIDNASTDNSVNIIKHKYPNITIIQNKKNLGFAKGYNNGIKHITEDIVCLLNSDVEPTHNWITPIINTFQNNPNIAAIQPKIKNYHKKEYFEYAGAAGGLIDALGYPYCRGRIINRLEKDNGQYDNNTEISWASGCAIFIRTKDFRSVGGFDERFFAHQEEIDLCWRLRNKGKKIYYCANSTIYHVGGGTLNKDNPKKTYLNFRNNLSMLLKNLPPYTIPIVIPIRLCLDGIAGIAYLAKGKPKHTWAIIKAHFAFYKQAPTSIKLRPKNTIKKYYSTLSIFLK